MSSENKIKEKVTEEKPPERPIDEMRETWFSKFFSMKFVLIIHIFAYIAVNGLCYMLNLMIWQGRLWAWHVTFGWGIGMSCHLALYYIFTSDIKSISKLVLLVHLTVYSVVNVYLFLINIVYMMLSPGVWWVVYPVALWGFGVLMNGLLNYMIEGRKLSKEQIEKIIGGVLLLTHIGYYGIVNALLFALGKFSTEYHLAVATLLYWGLSLVIGHAGFTIMNNYLEISEAKQGFLGHAIIFTLVTVIVLTDTIFFSEGAIFLTQRINAGLISFSLWAIALLAHGILAWRWDQTGGDVKDFMKWLFVMHCVAYAAGVAVMIGLNLIIWEGRMWWITSSLGWLIGLALHGLLYSFIRDEEKDALKISVYLHLIVYIATIAFLVWLNLAFWQGRFWVPTVALGWLVGLAEHLLIHKLLEKDMFTTENALKATVYMHLLAYVIVAGLLVWLNLAIWEGRLWAPIPLAGWIVGLGVHILVEYLLSNQ